MKLNQFDDTAKVVYAPWLRSEINKIRPNGVSPQGFSKLRKDACINHNSFMLTQREAAKLVFVSLYKPNGINLVKSIVNGCNLKDMDPLSMNRFFNMWTYLGAPYSNDLLIDIINIPLVLTLRDFLDLARLSGISIDIGSLRQYLGRYSLNKSSSLTNNEFKRLVESYL